jgi:hypothetical protein
VTDTESTPTVPLWRVRRDGADPTPWRITSPRGVEMYSTDSHRSAATLAHTFASVDELLARVYRLERQTFGGHPALRASARPRTLTVAPEPHVGRPCCASVIPGPHVPGCDFEPREPLDYDGPVTVLQGSPPPPNLLAGFDGSEFAIGDGDE